MAKMVTLSRHAAVSCLARWLSRFLIVVTLSSTLACERSAPSANKQGRQPAVKNQRKASFCKPSIPLDHLKDSNGLIQDVRIFQFSQTILYIPTKWLGDLATTSEPARVAGLEPILSRGECAGVVHHLLNRTGTLDRYIDISIGVSGTHGQIVSGKAPTYLSFWKMRNIGRFGEANDPSLKFDRLVSSKLSRSEDAFVRVLPDIGVRLDWRPTSITEDEWRRKAGEWRAPPRPLSYNPKPNEIGAWGAVVGTPEWRIMAANVRSLVKWLSTPPAMRKNNKKFSL